MGWYPYIHNFLNLETAPSRSMRLMRLMTGLWRYSSSCSTSCLTRDYRLYSKSRLLSNGGRRHRQGSIYTRASLLVFSFHKVMVTGTGGRYICLFCYVILFSGTGVEFTCVVGNFPCLAQVTPFRFQLSFSVITQSTQFWLRFQKVRISS